MTDPVQTNRVRERRALNVPGPTDVLDVRAVLSNGLNGVAIFLVEPCLRCGVQCTHDLVLPQ